MPGAIRKISAPLLVSPALFPDQVPPPPPGPPGNSWGSREQASYSLCSCWVMQTLSSLPPPPPPLNSSPDITVTLSWSQPHLVAVTVLSTVHCPPVLLCCCVAVLLLQSHCPQSQCPIFTGWDLTVAMLIYLNNLSVSLVHHVCWSQTNFHLTVLYISETTVKGWGEKIYGPSLLIAALPREEQYRIRNTLKKFLEQHRRLRICNEKLYRSRRSSRSSRSKSRSRILRKKSVVSGKR